MSGKKDFVSIAQRSHMQKHLILSNLKELHPKFKTSYPNIKTCFSNFCSHHPKWCITVGASGTHTVCCLCPENAILRCYLENELYFHNDID